jgi:hypothetical protein
MRSQVSVKELANLLTSIVKPGGAVEATTFLTSCHDGFQSFGSMPYERFFCKWLSFKNFDLTVPRFVADSNSVTEADLQFKRPSCFPSPFLNRNRSPIRELTRIFDSHYGKRSAITIHNSAGIQIHYSARSKEYVVGLSESPKGECLIYDEPHSSGSISEDETMIRNDFVVIRFHRAPNEAIP